MLSGCTEQIEINPMNQKQIPWYELPPKRWRNKSDQYLEQDSQRQKLYDAETYAIKRMQLEFEEGIKEFSSLEEIQKFVDKLTTSAWFRRRWVHYKVVVWNTRGTWAR